MFWRAMTVFTLAAACVVLAPPSPAYAQASACEAETPAAATADDYVDRARACWALLGTPSRIEPEVVLRLTLQNSTAALERDPRNAEAYALRGHMRLVTGARGQAVADLTLALHFEPSADAYVLRGLTMQSLDDFAGAQADFDAAVALAPDDPDVLAARGLYHFQREAWAAALADFEQVIALDPTNGEAYRYLGEIHERNGALAEALAAYERHLEVAERASAAVNARVLLLRDRLGDAADD